MKKSFIIEAICFLFIFLFIYAAISKLVDFEKFKTQIGQSPLLTDFVSIVVWLVPILEIALSLLFLIATLRIVALYLSFGLMIFFSAYIIYITQSGDHIPCSCGGILQSMSWGQHLVFNLSFVALAGLAILIHPPSYLRVNQGKPKTCITE